MLERMKKPLRCVVRGLRGLRSLNLMKTYHEHLVMGYRVYMSSWNRNFRRLTSRAKRPLERMKKPPYEVELGGLKRSL